MDDIIRQESTYIGTRLGAAAGSVIGLFVTDQLSLWWIPLIFMLFYSIGSTAWFLMEKSYQAQREAQAAVAAAERAKEEQPREARPIRVNAHGRQVGVLASSAMIPADGEDDLIFALDEEGEL